MLFSICSLLLLAGSAVKNFAQAAATPNQDRIVNKTYTNPILPGWHSDPSCVFVEELDNTFFCVTSTFLAFPGLPIYASKDLIHWKLISSVFNRPTQFPSFGNTSFQNGGIWAPTIRYNNGTFYVITAQLNLELRSFYNFIFNSTNPYTDSGWSNALFYDAFGVDPSLYFEASGRVYITEGNFAATGIVQTTIDPATGVLGKTPGNPWNGTGAVSPEGPHLYQKDGYYYLMIAEGGTELGHRETIARSKRINGPYHGDSHNPILTNANTSEYFQTVGHGDLFEDKNGNWWGVALATRCGPEYQTWPMGRETVLYPVTWETGKFPVPQPVRGIMQGPLPATNKDIPGSGAFVDANDVVDFEPDTPIPSHFVYWRYPDNSAYTVSPFGHENQLRLSSSNLNLTAYPGYDPLAGITFLGRRQTDTLFTYTVDITFSPSVYGEETGVSVFLTQAAHLDLGLIFQNSSQSSDSSLKFVFRVVDNDVTTSTVTSVVPATWLNKSIRMKIQAINVTHYEFSAARAGRPTTSMILGHAPADIVSGGYTGSLVGAYATNNGFSGATPSYVGRWRYTGQGQYIGNGTFIDL